MVDDAISESTKEKLQTLATRIAATRNKLLIVTSTLTPLNYQEEMEKFLRSDTYNPIFVYKNNPVPNISIEKKELYSELKKLQLPDELHDHIELLLLDLELLENTRKSIGSQDFAEHANLLFNWGRDRLDLLLANTPKVSFAMYTKHQLKDAFQIKEHFENVLAKYKITELAVTVDTFSTHIISITHKGIKIGSKVKRYQCNVDRLVVHEIESHGIQEINTIRNNNKLSHFTKYSNMHLYAEGLAVYNEIHTRKITPEAFEMYFNRIRAVHQLHKSFRDIFESLINYIPLKNAYVLTYRVKRGMANTGDPGGFPKDAAYLLGYHEIENLIADGYPRKLLYATKSPVLTSLLLKYKLFDTNNILTPHFK